MSGPRAHAVRERDKGAQERQIDVETFYYEVIK